MIDKHGIFLKGELGTEAETLDNTKKQRI